MQEKIFEPFFTTKAKVGGTGLGLATVYGIMQQCGGSITVDSEPGRGSRFTLTFPTAPVAGPAERAAVALPEEEEVGHGEIVLVVEDEGAVRLVAERILSRAGYQVITASGGAEALRLCEERAGPIHLALSDVVMPEMSGPEFASALEHIRPEVPVLFMSGYTEDALGRHGALGESVALLHKPFSSAQLRRKVRHVLDTARLRKPAAR